MVDVRARRARSGVTSPAASSAILHLRHVDLVVLAMRTDPLDPDNELVEVRGDDQTIVVAFRHRGIELTTEERASSALTNIWIRFSKGRSHAQRCSDHAQLNGNPLERAARHARAGSAKDSAGPQLFAQGLEDSTLRKFSMTLLGPAGPGKTLAKYGPYSVAELPPNKLVVPGINGPPRLHRHLCSSACVV